MFNKLVVYNIFVYKFVCAGTGEDSVSQAEDEREGGDGSSGEALHQGADQLPSHRDQHLPSRAEPRQSCGDADGAQKLGRCVQSLVPTDLWFSVPVNKAQQRRKANSDTVEQEFSKL